MADAVSGSRKYHSISGSNCLKIPVIIRIYRTYLDGVVVHVDDRQFSINTVQPKSLEMLAYGGASGVMSERLIDIKS
jgi:hypothetical protein